MKIISVECNSKTNENEMKNYKGKLIWKSYKL